MKKIYSAPIIRPFSILMKEAMCAYPATATAAPGFSDPDAPKRRMPL